MLYWPVDLGVFHPQSNLLDNSMAMNLGYEYYLSPNLSWRASLGWANPGFSAPGIDSVRHVPFHGDVNYNWDSGEWRPFVGAGVGADFLQFRTNGQTIGGTEAAATLNIGGGTEYFINKTVSWKGEMRYHLVSSTRGLDPSGLAITVGIKTYF